MLDHKSSPDGDTWAATQGIWSKRIDRVASPATLITELLYPEAYPMSPTKLWCGAGLGGSGRGRQVTGSSLLCSVSLLSLYIQG